jgi:hypothetical protein
MKVMTLREAAEELGLAANTLRIQANHGVLKANKIGRDWVVTQREVERYRTEVQGQFGNRYTKRGKLK